MATHSISSSSTFSSQSPSSNRAVAMLLALVAAVALSPLYVNGRRSSDARYERNRWSYSSRWSCCCGFVQPMVLAGIIVAIKAVSSSQRSGGGGSQMLFPSMDSSFVVRFGSSSWGLAGVLVMLVLVLSWQGSVQEFFWR